MSLEKREFLLEYTSEQIALIKNTIAKNATDDELQLFFYRCKRLHLDPLRPGQIYFIKYGNSPGTIVIGLEGFRSRAAQTGKHSGTKRGVLRNAKGECVGAWAEVYRSDWQHPARDEVSLKEYNTGRNQWQKMPETMIKKVAECATLRMAFPDELGGVYSEEEMGQAEGDIENGDKHKVDQKSKLVTPEKTSAQLLEEIFQTGDDLGYSRDETKAKLKTQFPTATKLNSIQLTEAKKIVSALPMRANLSTLPASKDELEDVPF